MRCSNIGPRGARNWFSVLDSPRQLLSPHSPDVRRGTRCYRSGSCRGAAPPSGAFRRCSPADSPVGALAHRGAPLGATRKKIFATIIVFFMFAGLAACSPGGNEQGKAKQVTMHLFTWSDYTEETVVKEFERRFGVKVVTDTFGSNEELLAKLQGGAAGYDVVVPSDYMVSILIKQGLLAELDHAKIPNLAHVYKHLKGLYYDPQNTYSVPYLWGTTGIGYNADLVKPPPESWQPLWDARYKGKISLLNDEREVFGMALRAAGESLNATQPAKLEEIGRAHV